MGVQEEIKRMKAEGRTDMQIIDSLRRQRFSDREISDALAQLKIKEAVSASPKGEKEGFSAGAGVEVREGNEAPAPSGDNIFGVPLSEQKFASEAPQQETEPELPIYQPPEETAQSADYGGGYQSQGYVGAEQSASAPGPGQQPQYEQQPQYTQQYAQDYGYAQGYPAGAYAADAYAQYQPYQQAMSSDLITEISEQVVSEKLSSLQDELEKAINFRTVAEARISSLSERLVRIEKILDKLQLSLLQKVGEYVGNVQDMKKELEETQKSFKVLAEKGGRRKSSKHHHAKSSHPHHEGHEHSEHSHHAHEHHGHKHP